jgi:hypothetical protein
MSSNFKSWIGVDLDGTLAHYDKWISEEHIGEPIPLMATRVHRWLLQDKDVRIFTARIFPLRYINPGDNMLMFTGANEREAQAARSAHHIQLWCEKHFGKKLPITCTKDMAMGACWDDRAVQVVPNTGQRVDGCVD